MYNSNLSNAIAGKTLVFYQDLVFDIRVRFVSLGAGIDCAAVLFIPFGRLVFTRRKDIRVILDIGRGGFLIEKQFVFNAHQTAGGP